MLELSKKKREGKSRKLNYFLFVNWLRQKSMTTWIFSAPPSSSPTSTTPREVSPEMDDRLPKLPKRRDHRRGKKDMHIHNTFPMEFHPKKSIAHFVFAKRETKSGRSSSSSASRCLEIRRKGRRRHTEHITHLCSFPQAVGIAPERYSSCNTKFFPQ